MAFPKQESRQFTRANIEALSPNQNGCYGLFKQGTWIYVGKGDIRTRLLAHFNRDNSCIARQAPTHWVDMVTANMDQMEKDLILELDPLCNKKVG